ncbi:uncharacterized protein DNG_10297 [Cephalotrichum gorgonifer]|uniref:HET domain-containing protein n=1 Tax=Cephalotrichum gorgonifer TaxID=2041049 RepID=A0AAE8N969_9PEZI|nr:uncharacterized protein DNG_10297 [Cephalotrichum gorgonifer]
MKLLHTKTLGLETFYDSQTRPPYLALSLSYSWEPGHPRYQDLIGHGLDGNPAAAAAATSESLSGSGPGPTSTLVRRACDVAEQLGFQYIWAECICVDASSTAEVSEAVNSAFRWLSDSAACLAYLPDLPSSGDDPFDEALWRSCEWWTRPWTLPELLAPSAVRFYDGDWNFRGEKTSAPLLSIISRVTHISEDILCNSSQIPQVSIAKRMSWAAHRRARRIEDTAYSLMGVFGVHMQAIYGEGHKAFLRLQEEIIKDTRDMSLLAWEAQADDERPFRGLFASSPSEFARFTSCPPQWCRPLCFEGEIHASSRGLSITGAFIAYPSDSRQILLLDLGAQSAPHRKVVLALLRHNDCLVRSASNAVVTLTRAVSAVTTSFVAARDLDAAMSKAIADTLLPSFSFTNSLLTIPSASTCTAKAVPMSPPPIPAASLPLPLRVLADAPALARHCGRSSIAASTESYVFSRAATSLAPMPPDFTSRVKKRALPTTTALPDRQDKRAKTRGAAAAADDSETLSGSETTSLPDAESADDDGSESTASQEDLSVFDDISPEPPPVLEEGHPFLSILDELICTARSEFTSWQDSPRDQAAEGTTNPPGTRYLACPFWARDPERHGACLRGAELRRTLDVKVHLWQKHRLPNYCPVCYAFFETGSERNEHIVRRSCELRPRPRLDGVSEDQKQRLAKRDRVSASREEKWLTVWEILFPDETPPPKPYPDGEAGRLISLVREFWDRRGQVVVSSFLQRRDMLSWDMPEEERSLSALHALVLGRMIDSIYEEEKWEMVAPSPAGAGVAQRGGGALASGLLSSAGVLSLGALPPGAFPLPEDVLPGRGGLRRECSAGTRKTQTQTQMLTATGTAPLEPNTLIPSSTTESIASPPLREEGGEGHLADIRLTD